MFSHLAGSHGSWWSLLPWSLTAIANISDIIVIIIISYY